MTAGPIIALSGGVGGAKLVLGLSHAVPGDQLIVVTNTGDDFDHLGLRICPDTDTVLYTLSGLSNTDLGWGRADETWTFMRALKELGGEDWFNLGDGDMALHVLRTNRLSQGVSLSNVTAEIAASLGIGPAILPMCNEPIATMVRTPQGRLAFQHYFVRDRCEPTVAGFEFEGISDATINPDLVTAMTKNPQAIVIAPSNPYVSVDPILAVPGMRAMLRESGIPIVAVSPIVGKQAIKGPAAKMMRELGVPASSLEIARHYRGLVDALVIDEQDAEIAPAIAELGLDVRVTQTVMNDLEDRYSLAKTVLNLADQLCDRLTR